MINLKLELEGTEVFLINDQNSSGPQMLRPVSNISIPFEIPELLLVKLSGNTYFDKVRIVVTFKKTESENEE